MFEHWCSYMTSVDRCIISRPLHDQDYDNDQKSWYYSPLCWKRHRSHQKYGFATILVSFVFFLNCALFNFSFLNEILLVWGLKLSWGEIHRQDPKRQGEVQNMLLHFGQCPKKVQTQ